LAVSQFEIAPGGAVHTLIEVQTRKELKMIFIVVKWQVRPEFSDEWLSIVADFTTATRAEPGNIFFDWSRSVSDPNEFVLLEAFRDNDAGAAHVRSEHFKAAVASLPDAVADTPQIINVEVPGDGWATMAEVQPRRAKSSASQT
jgi:quinol monooxygenase YgiN